MKPYIIVLAFVGMLLSCSGNVQEKLTQTRDDTVFSVELNVVPEQDIVSVCTKLGTQYDANGCNSFNKETKKCTIYVVAPSFVEDSSKLAVIGHELWHCRYGRFHL